MPERPRLKAVLFDLDGTLLDTAPDLVAALNHVREFNGFDPLPLSELRNYVSRGAGGLIGAGMPAASQAQRDDWCSLLLSYYDDNVYVESRAFEGMGAILSMIAEKGLAWGVVTNKAKRFTEPVLRAAALQPAPGSVVCGDTLPQRKPEPEPVLLACSQLGVAPEHTMMVGDDERDIMAARAAGCYSVAAAYGYIPPDQDPQQWGSDAVIDSPRELASLL